MLSKEQFGDWLENPATMEVLRAIRLRAKELEAYWKDRAWRVTYRDAETQVEAAIGKGEARAYGELSEIDHHSYLVFIGYDFTQDEEKEESGQ